MTYTHEPSKVIYQSTACPRPGTGNGKQAKIFDALQWLVTMAAHNPNKGEQIARDYGYYSNVSRSKRKKAGARWVDLLCSGA